MFSSEKKTVTTAIIAAKDISQFVKQKSRALGIRLFSISEAINRYTVLTTLEALGEAPL